MSLNGVVQEAVELLAYELRTDNIEVVFDLADDLAVLWADAHQLHQVIVNLVANAHQAMRRTAAPRRIRLTTRRDRARARVQLEIADTGPGIPHDIQARIFEPFFTTKPPGQGTGLGLSLCRGIIEEHGGTLGVESEPGHGATFRIELPLLTRPASAPEAVSQPLAPLESAPKRILVVDDEPGVAGVLAEALGRVGHHVEVAADGAQALEILAGRACDLIITDTKMPGLDGIDLREAGLPRAHRRGVPHEAIRRPGGAASRAPGPRRGAVPRGPPATMSAPGRRTVRRSGGSHPGALERWPTS